MTQVLAPLALIALIAASPVRAAADTEEGWQSFGHALTLVQTIVGIAARSDDPAAAQKGMDDVFAGRNSDANRALSGLFDDMTSDMPAQYRGQVASIGRDIASLARRGPATAPLDAAGTDEALQARKDLTAMGLSYYDARQFLEAVRRDDALAVQLYVQGRGVNLSSRDAAGHTGLDIARANRNARIEGLLARNLPSTR
jgi:hypothetical protein